MPYIIVRSSHIFPLDEGAFHQSTTLIDCRVHEQEIANLVTALKNLGATRGAVSWTIKIAQPPDLVLNRLETLGYKVVGTNTVKQVLIWTLHKQA